MATIHRHNTEDIHKKNVNLSPFKSIIETAFYANNVKLIDTIVKAYDLAKSSSRTILLDQKITNAQELGLPSDAKILLENGNHIVGRTAASRRILGLDTDEDKKLTNIVLDAIYNGSNHPFISGDAIIGLDEEFMVQAHIMMPETESPNLYSWLLNFQIKDLEYSDRYQKSQKYNDNDIFIYFDPSWSHNDYPEGLAIFDTKHNVTAILGMQYFGEIKKGTLTLAWATAVRHGYLASHGGLKKISTSDQQHLVAAFFGLSGSGKSTLTHAKHDNKYVIEVLHDDAFIINLESGASIALEPAYFDKTNDYPIGHPEQDHFLTVQNVGVTLNESGNKVLVTEDLRNKNGRTIKSRFSTPDRIDKIDEPINAIFWIMKDDTLPPIVRITDPATAATFGATLVTKRSSAENVKNEGEVVVEPYANPFRVYPLLTDYQHFRTIFDHQVDCYIINTGTYLGQDIKAQTTLSIIESIAEETAEFQSFLEIDNLEYIHLDNYAVPETDIKYLQDLLASMTNRLTFLENRVKNSANDALPEEAIASLQKIISQLKVK